MALLPTQPIRMRHNRIIEAVRLPVAFGAAAIYTLAWAINKGNDKLRRDK